MALTARYSVRTLVRYLIGSFAFVAVGVWRTLPSDSEISLRLGPSILFFGLTAVVFCLKLFDKRESLVVDHHGLFDRRVVDKPIPWSAVSGVKESRVRTRVFFNISLSRPVSEFVVSRRKGILIALNQRLGGGVYISANALTVDTEQIRKALKAFMPGGASVIT